MKFEVEIIRFEHFDNDLQKKCSKFTIRIYKKHLRPLFLDAILSIAVITDKEEYVDIDYITFLLFLKRNDFILCINELEKRSEEK